MNKTVKFCLIEEIGNTNKLVGKHTNKQVDKQTNKQVNRQTNKQVDKQTNKQTNQKKTFHRKVNIYLMLTFLYSDLSYSNTVNNFRIQIVKV